MSISAAPTDASPPHEVERQLREHLALETLVAELAERFVSADPAGLDTKIGESQARLYEALEFDSLRHLAGARRRPGHARRTSSSGPSSPSAQARSSPARRPRSSSKSCAPPAGRSWFRTRPRCLLKRAWTSPRTPASASRAASTCPRAAETLRVSEEKFRTAFMTVVDASYLATLDDGRIVDCNSQFVSVFGYEREELLGKTALGLNLYDDPADRQRMVEELKANGLVRELEVWGRKKSGERILVSISVSTLRMGSVPHILGVVRNITQRS